MNIKTLIQQLRKSDTRFGIGVWLMPREYLGKEQDIAARLNVQSLDAREAYLKLLPPGARFSGLTRPGGHQNLLRLLRQLTETTHRRDFLLVHTLDLLLLGLEVDERERFWREVLDGIPYPRTRLVLSIPEKAPELFSYDLTRQYTKRVAEGKIPSRSV